MAEDPFAHMQQELAEIHGQRAEHTVADLQRVMDAYARFFAEGIRQQALMPYEALLSFIARTESQFLEQLNDNCPTEASGEHPAGTVVFPLPLGSTFRFVIPAIERYYASRMVAKGLQTTWAQSAEFEKLERMLRTQVKLVVLPNPDALFVGDRTYRPYGQVIIPSGPHYHLFSIDKPQEIHLPLGAKIIPGKRGVVVAQVFTKLVPEGVDRRVGLVAGRQLLAVTIDDAIAETRKNYHRANNLGTLAIARGTNALNLYGSAVPMVEIQFSARLDFDDKLSMKQKP